MMASSPLGNVCLPRGALDGPRIAQDAHHLILTLNHMYPDYDFSALRGHHFTKEDPGTGVLKVKNDVDGLLLESAKVYEATIGAGAEP